MRIAITADLHWGHGPRGDRAATALRDFLAASPPDLLLLGGDQGTGEHFAECLQLFDPIKCAKALVLGNHDLWVNDPDPRGDSWQMYEQVLPTICAEHGFHYLDKAPLIVSPELAIVGSVNWYDYSWSLEKLKNVTPDWDWHLRNKVFTRGRHNDARFVRWDLDDAGFTRLVVDRFKMHLDEALVHAKHVLVLTHHPAVYEVNFPRDDPPQTLDGLLWDAFSGNEALREILECRHDRLVAIFSGHTHRARENHFANVPAINIGGDYHFKRLLFFDWPGGAIESHTFEAGGGQREL